MKRLTYALLAALALWSTPSSAQQPITLPPNTIYGRLGVTAGPGQAIPFATFLALSGVGNVLGPGSSTVGDLATWANTTGTLLADAGVGVAVSTPILHQNSGGVSGNNLLRGNANADIQADHLAIFSYDQSLITTFVVGGSKTTGDVVGFNFTINNVGFQVRYTVQSGDTLTTIAAALAACINGGSTNCTGGAALVAAYAAFKPTTDNIGYLPRASNNGTTLILDFPYAASGNSIGTSLSGGATETLTAGANNLLDNGPVYKLGRYVAGRTPVSGDQIGNIQYNCQSGASTNLDANCASLPLFYLGGTSGSAVYARLGLSAAANNMNALPVAFVGPKGLYTTKVDGTGNGCAGFTADTTTADDPGFGNFAVCGRQFVGVTNYSGNLDPTTLAQSEVNGVFRVTGNASEPSTGAGVEINFHSAVGQILSIDQGAGGLWKPLQLQGLSIDIQPSSSASTGWTATANKLNPTTDNVTQIGDSTHNVSNVFATVVTTPGCVFGGTNSSARCSSALTTEPQFQITNTTTDAQSGFFIMQKSRTGTNTLTSDHLFQFQFQGFATSFSASAGIDILQTGASSGANIPSKILLQTSNAAGQLNQNLVFDSAAHVSTVQASAPTLTAGCNGAGSSVSGTDTYGTVTGQTSAATTCTLTFGTAFGAAPACTVTGITSAILTITPATGTLVATFASTATYKFTYICHGA